MNHHDHPHRAGHRHSLGADDPGHDTLLCVGAGQRLTMGAIALLALWLSIWWALR